MTVAVTVVTTDVAGALAIAWDAFRSAARDDLTGWEVTAAAAQVQPEPPLTGGDGHAERRYRSPVSGQDQLPGRTMPGTVSAVCDIFRVTI